MSSKHRTMLSQTDCHISCMLMEMVSSCGALSLPSQVRKGHMGNVTYKLQFMNMPRGCTILMRQYLNATGQSQVSRADSGSRSALEHDKRQKIGRVQKSHDGSKQLSSSPNSNTSSIIAA